MVASIWTCKQAIQTIYVMDRLGQYCNAVDSVLDNAFPLDGLAACDE